MNYKLSQNYPNPFNPNTVISYELKAPSFITLKVYDINGKEIETLVTENKNAGVYNVSWNAENHPSGVYYYKLSSDNFSETKKMVLLR